MKKLSTLLILIIMIITTTACGMNASAANIVVSNDEAAASNDLETLTSNSEVSANSDAAYESDDLDSSLSSDDVSTTQLNGDTATVDGSSITVDESNSVQETIEATFNETDEVTEYTSLSNNINLSDYEANSVVNITAAGEYILSGTLTDGQVVVDVGNEDEVGLLLDNAEITNNSGSGILVLNAEKVVITLNDGTVNTITDGTNYTDLDEDGEPDAAIFSHDDLTINGSGSLTVQANYGDGIESRDDLKITGGIISVTAVDIGLFGNNSIEMKTAAVVITAGGDTIHSDGDIIIESGTLTLISGDDGMHADGTLTINDGTIDIQKCYEGIEATDVIINSGTINIEASDDGINGAGGNDNSGNNSTNGFPQDNFSGSQATITINGGTITIAAAGSGNGDGLDANGSITISGGDTVIKTPSSYRDYSDIDYNTTFSLTGGSVRILGTSGTYTQVTENNVSNNTRGGRQK